MHMKKQIALLVALLQLSLLTIARAETFTLILGPNTLPAFVTGQPFSISLTATGGVSPYAWNPLALPQHRGAARRWQRVELGQQRLRQTR